MFGWEAGGGREIEKEERRQEKRGADYNAVTKW